MKRIIPVFLAILILTGNVSVYARTSSTSFTYTLLTTGGVGISQDAYIPAGVLMDFGLNAAQDLFVLGMNMYVADTGNSRALVVDLNTMEYKVIGEGILANPRGIAADAEGRIFVADNQAVFRFNAYGELEFTFTRPTTPNFGRNEPFNPVKVAPSFGGGVYIVSEGTTAGIIFMNGLGEFLGYFASNNVDMSVTQRIMNAVLTEEQRARFLRIVPAVYANIFRGEDGLIYTINRGSGVRFRRHSISGIDLLSHSSGNFPLNDVGDIHVAADGRMYAVEQGTGIIYLLQNEGYLLSAFAGTSIPNERIGLFVQPSGIGVDANGRLFVLDQVRNFIQIFEPTPTQLKLYEAMALYEEGLYTESKEILQEMLIFNNASFLGHLYMGRINMQLLDFEGASYHFRIANLADLYSQAYWEIRNAWLQSNMTYILFGMLLLIVIWRVIKFADKRFGILSFTRKVQARLVKYRLYRDLTVVKYVLRHPIDNAYNVHVGITGSYTAGLIISALLFVIFIFAQVGMGFIFSVDIEFFSFMNAALYFVCIPLLFIGVNYYVASIYNGNGTFKEVFLSVVYGFTPVLLFMPFIILFANVSTLNEAFLIVIGIGFLLVWSVVNIFISLMEVHEYSFKETVKSLFITFFYMLVVVLALSILYMLGRQLFSFVREIIAEVLLRV
jgi:DNA-binding beta-propeller fold protein YncE